jgi:transposase
MDSHSAQVCRLEVVNTGRRRRWSFEEKLRIVEESYRGHRQASATARRHDISQSLLFRWRKAFRQGWLGMAPDELDLVPAIITRDDDPDDDDDDGSSTPIGRMEIVTRHGGRVIVDADVDAGALARVLEVLDRR